MFTFNNNKGFTKNYLRIYGNMDLDKYSEEYKREITEKFVQLATQLTNSTKLKFDIDGIGFRVSKGSYLEQKAFNNKIDKIGYKNLNGITVISEEANYKSGFSLFIKSMTANRIDMYFSWPYLTDKNLNNAFIILNKVADFVRIDYAYAYPADRSLNEIGEGKIVKGIFSITGSTPKEELKWNAHIKDVKTGSIKKLYPVNVFNRSQINILQGISPDKEIKLKDESEIWQFEIDKVQKLNLSVANRILK